MYDVTSIKQEAIAEVLKERGEAAKKALVRKLKERQAALDVVANIDRAIADLEASIADGSFTG